ncbi:hypothetical protein CRUP_036023 [Coryphaenoides rupestris]|nr:hypothetical protein CRUP_036023 [Coryphaenoides rupestris]
MNRVPQNSVPQNGVPQNGASQSRVPQNGGCHRTGRHRAGCHRTGVPQNGASQSRVPQNGGCHRTGRHRAGCHRTGGATERGVTEQGATDTCLRQQLCHHHKAVQYDRLPKVQFPELHRLQLTAQGVAGVLQTPQGHVLRIAALTQLTVDHQTASSTTTTCTANAAVRRWTVGGTGTGTGGEHRSGVLPESPRSGNHMGTVTAAAAAEELGSKAGTDNMIPHDSWFIMVSERSAQTQQQQQHQQQQQEGSSPGFVRRGGRFAAADGHDSEKQKLLAAGREEDSTPRRDSKQLINNNNGGGRVNPSYLVLISHTVVKI